MQNMSGGKTALGLDSNVGAMLSYIPVCGLNLIYSIVVLLTDKTNKLPRFHAVQSLLLLGIAILLYLGAAMIFGVGLAANSTLITGIAGLLYLLVVIAFFSAVIFCAIKAYQGQLFKIPVIGDLADKWSN